MGDNLTRGQRSYCMSRVRSKGTDIELLVRSQLHRRGLRFRTQDRSLPGRPDMVFKAARVAVFIDGDFWHGYRFPAWRDNLPEFWVEKISKNRARDRKNFARLRLHGWKVVRLWQHEIKADLDRCVQRVEIAVREGTSQFGSIAACRALNHR